MPCRLITLDFVPHNVERVPPPKIRCVCFSAGSCMFNDKTWWDGDCGDHVHLFFSTQPPSPNVNTRTHTHRSIQLHTAVKSLLCWFASFTSKWLHLKACCCPKTQHTDTRGCPCRNKAVIKKKNTVCSSTCSPTQRIVRSVSLSHVVPSKVTGITSQVVIFHYSSMQLHL